MPYTAEHKARTRERIVAAARVMFNRHGFEGVSIDDVMHAAGLTRGGFYRHFASKDELYAAAVKSFAACNPFRERLAARARPPRSAAVVARMLVDTYLSDATYENVDDHCPLVALPSDVARAGLAPRASYTALVESMTRVFRAAVGGRGPERERRALRVVTLIVGGMVLARTVHDPKLQRDLRANARAEALALLSAGRKRRR